MLDWRTLPGSSRQNPMGPRACKCWHPSWATETLESMSSNGAQPWHHIRITWGDFFKNFIYLKKIFFNIYLFLRQRETDRAWTGEGQREGDTESETGSRLRAVSTEPDAGLELTDWRDCDLIQSWLLNRLSHPGAPEVRFLKETIHSKGEVESILEWHGHHRIFRLS